MEDTTSGLNHHVGLVAVQIEDIRGVPKRFPKEGTYLTIEVEENPKMVHLWAGTGLFNFRPDFLSETIAPAQVI